MGNCLRSPNTSVISQTSTQHHSYVSKSATSKTTSSSIPSTLTCSTPSNISVTVNNEALAGASHPKTRTEGEILASENLVGFSYNDLRNATRNFRPDSLIGEGGFGYVYKGWIDEQTFAPSRPGLGMIVAVKKLKSDAVQGHKEWLAEVNYLGQLHHPNLVKLIGYSLEGDNRLLVYEFMQKGSLEYHLFRRSNEPLAWATRIRIAVGAAQGLSFLNDECQIIYRDVKAANILLDSDFSAKLSDFGLAKDGPTGDKTHISTQIMGTHGYAAPEYIATGRISLKADVYSFGVVLLEILTGRRALDKTMVAAEQNLVEWVKVSLGDKHKIHRIIDPRLESRYPKKGAHELSLLALACINKTAKLRPRMSDVAATLVKLQESKYTASSRQTTDRGKSPGSVPRSPVRNPRSPVPNTRWRHPSSEQKSHV